MRMINMKITNIKVDNLSRIKRVMILLVISILIPTFLSGCVNPMEKVPVMKINITYTERQGIAEPDSHSFTQDSVSYIDRPKRTQAQSFPAIIGRTTVIKKVIKNDAKFNGTVIGPWESLPYKGNGSYSFYVGFYDGGYPESGDTIHVSVMVVDSTGQRIGYITEDETWK
jgi:hypothetical protein